MMKRILCLLAALLLCSAAFADPRYPDQSGVATDAASVLSVKVVEDLRKLDKRLNKAEAPRLYIATVDFLDATDAQTYADELFDRWDLDDDEVLLILCVGEESYAIAAGKNARRILSDNALNKLLAGSLHEPFLDMRYDEALASFAKGFAIEVERTCGVTIKTEDLFRNVTGSLFGGWASTQQRVPASEEDGESFLTRQDKSSGFSLLSVLIIVALLFLVFGTFRKSRKMRAPAPEAAGGDAPEGGKTPASAEPGKKQYPVYFKPREKKPTPQYFKPRKPR